MRNIEMEMDEVQEYFDVGVSNREGIDNDTRDLIKELTTEEKDELIYQIVADWLYSDISREDARTYLADRINLVRFILNNTFAPN